MTYEYACPKCPERFDVIKSVKEMEREETCPKCESIASRQFIPSRVSFIGTSVQNAEWNPAFGCVVKDKQHRSELAKRHGVVEIGNDYGAKTPDSQHEHFEKQREKQRDTRWDKALDE